MNNYQKMNLNEFCDSFGYNTNNPSDSYELLANYSILTNKHSHDSISIDIQDSVHNHQINGACFDGFSILVDGHVMMTNDAISDYYKSNVNVNAEIVIVESNLIDDSSEHLNNLQNMINKAFAPVFGDVDLENNDNHSQSDDLITHLYATCTRYSSSLPLLKIYYVFDTINEDDKLCFEQIIQAIKDEYQPKDAFTRIEGTLYDTSEILKMYTRSKIKDTVTIMPYKTTIPLPSMRGVKDAYVAVVPFSEFKKLLTEDDIKIKPSIFHDNIRAFQGKTSVSKQMNETLLAGNFDQFIAMNNGVTVIASELATKQGGQLELKDYQIVNGCQTCHILFNNRKLNGIDELLLLVKIICSTDENVRNSVIMGTNSQIEVKREQLIALTGLQERIEDYYAKIRSNKFNKYEHLYYERRSKQYVTETRVPQNKVITIPIEIMSFGSIFLSSPHYVSGYYSQIIENLKNKGKGIFSDEYRVDPYYTSGLMFYKLSQLFATKFIKEEYKRLKYQLLYAARLVAEMDYKSMPELEKEEIEEYCDYLNTLFCDSERCKACFLKAVHVIDQVVPNKLSDSIAQKKGLTDSITDFVLKEKNESIVNMVSIEQDEKELVEVIGKKEPAYIETSGLYLAAKSIELLTNSTSGEIIIICGHNFNYKNENDNIIQSISAFVKKNGKLKIVLYNNTKEKILNSPLFSRLALLQSQGYSIVVKLLPYIPRITDGDSKYRFNMYMFDNKFVRVELQPSFLTGRIWLYDKIGIDRYKNLIEPIFENKRGETVDLVKLYNY